MSGEVKRYSESFKMHVVGELERGRYSCVWEASRAFGITGCGTVQSWVIRYGKNHLLKKVVRVEKLGEAKLVKKLKEENQKLKDALVDAVLERTYFEMVCEQQGIDPAEFKKKADGKPCTERRPKGK